MTVESETKPEPQGMLDTARAGGTYAYQWRMFDQWCRDSGRQSLPASPPDVSAYIEARLSAGASPSTVRVIAFAIARVHLDAGHPNPCAGKIEQKIAGMNENQGTVPQRSLPLDLDAYIAIRETAHQPRPSRGGHLESEDTARERGTFDVAAIGLMRDARLRVMEATQLRWPDLEHAPDGTGRIAIRDADGLSEPDYRFVSDDTMSLLAETRGDAGDDERIITLQPRQLTTRIGAAARQAGLGEGYSAESPRLGMIADLESIGVVLLGTHVRNSISTGAGPPQE